MSKMDSSRLKADDERLIARYVDEQLSVEHRAAFDVRCARDASLRAALVEAQQARELLAVDRDVESIAPSLDFVDSVVRAARRLPSRADLGPDDVGGADVGEVGANSAGSDAPGDLVVAETVRLAATVRHALVAAVLVCGAALVLFGGVLRQNDTGRLQASPEELRLLDQRIERARVASEGGVGVRNAGEPPPPTDAPPADGPVPAERR